MQRLSRKFLRVASSAPAKHGMNDKPAPKSLEVGSLSLASAQTGELKLNSSNGPTKISYSQAGYQAHDPFADKHVLTVDTTGPRPHLFAAVISSDHAALNAGQYIYRNLHKEVLAQFNTSADPCVALRAALEHLDTSFRSLHSFNRALLEGTRVAAAFLDLETFKLYALGTGSNHVVVGTRTATGDVAVLAEVGGAAASPSQPAQRSPGGASHMPSGIVEVQLENTVKNIMLGSAGLWQDVPSTKAALRMQHYYDSAPGAAEGNAAAHLTTFALQHIAERTRRQPDPRMHALQTPSHLQSLWVGSRKNYKWAGRQPVRRRRGDVHMDISSIVIHLSWPSSGSRSSSYSRLTGLMPKMPRLAAHANRKLAHVGASHWDLVRMHFLGYKAQSRAATRHSWYALVENVLQHRSELALEQQHRIFAASVLLSPNASPVSSPAASRRALAAASRRSLLIPPASKPAAEHSELQSSMESSPQLEDLPPARQQWGLQQGALSAVAALHAEKPAGKHNGQVQIHVRTSLDRPNIVVSSAA